MVKKKLKRLGKELLPLILKLAGVLILTAIFLPACSKSGTCDYFLLCILVGFPFGVGKMFLLIPPVKYGIGGSVGVFALDLILGGLLGCVILAVTFIGHILRILWVPFCAESEE